MDEEKKSAFEKVWEYRIEIFSGLLLIAGIILAFFYIHIGGVLVGLGVGLCFFEEMHSYFVQLRDFFLEHGIFKSLILIATIIYLLIAVPTFVLAAAVGYAAMYLVSLFAKK